LSKNRIFTPKLMGRAILGTVLYLGKSWGKVKRMLFLNKIEQYLYLLQSPSNRLFVVKAFMCLQCHGIILEG